MINLSMILMLIGVSGLITGVSLHTIITLYEEWKAGFKNEVLVLLVFLIPIILIAVGAIIYAIYK
ncbi:hypothetical protein [Mammaliicoccus sciuri]|uniref:hypothetical protein n=1 Tax=Mammaliicoccus sciuri TaxID=1296 RepID=UPI0034DCFFBD